MSKKDNVEDINLEDVSGGDTITYNREIDGNFNIDMRWEGDKVIANFEKLKRSGIFDNLKKQGES